MSPMSRCKHTSRTSYEEIQFEWEISDYFLNSVTTPHNYLDSSTFHFGKSLWRLRLFQSSSSVREYLFIENMTPGKEVEVEYEIGLKKSDGSVEQFFTGIKDFHQNLIGSVVCTSKSELLKRKHDLTPPNGLTIMCILRRGTPQQFVLHQAPPMTFTELDVLSNNFKTLSENKESCDVILKVKEKEFSAHKAILISRSPVFAAMFNTDTLEKRTSIIDIPDCDPDSFHEFLDYLYCGKLQDISFRCAFHLYKTADKYNVQGLASYCVEYMKYWLTEDNVCDVLILAELYDETKLMAAAQVFFNENVSKVVETTGWEGLMETNYLLANKVIIKMASTTKISY